MAKDYYIDGKKVIGWHTSSNGKRVPHFADETPLGKWQDKINNRNITDDDYKQMLDDFESWYNTLDKKEVEEVLEKLSEHRQRTDNLDIDKMQIKESNPLGEYLNKKLGYDKLPELIEEKDFFDTISFRGKEIIDYNTTTLDEDHWYRGITGDKAQEYIKDFKTGKYFAGEGYDASGSYFTGSHYEATQYTGYGETNEDNMLYIKPKDTAKIVNYSKIKDIGSGMSSKIDYNKYMSEEGEIFVNFADNVLSDAGYLSSILGYDILDFKGYDSRKVILNRSAIKVVK